MGLEQADPSLPHRPDGSLALQCCRPCEREHGSRGPATQLRGSPSGARRRASGEQRTQRGFRTRRSRARAPTQHSPTPGPQRPHL